MQFTARRDWGQLGITALVILVCIVAIGWLQIPQLQQLRVKSQMASVSEIRRDTDAEAVRLALLQKAPSLGFDNLIADWTFLNFLQYFGDEPARKKTDYRLSPEYFEVILGRDPHFLRAYTFLSTSTSLYAGLADRSVAIMQKGLESLQPNLPPGSYYAWRQLGIDQLLFLGDTQAALQSFKTAADWARRSTLPNSTFAADLSQQTADFLATNPNSKTAQVAAWAMVLENAPDDRTRKTAVRRIESLGGKILENPDGSFRVQPPVQD